jgi:hypothetical protein
MERDRLGRVVREGGNGAEDRAMNKRDRGTATEDGVLAQESDAFLNGTLAEYWEDKGITVPVWAWTNLLAHGSLEQIVESVASPGRPRRYGRNWSVARAYVAYEVLDLLDAEFTLADMQSTVLIPLELEMAARPEVSRWTPRQWVDTVDFAIRHTHLQLEL